MTAQPQTVKNFLDQAKETGYAPLRFNGNKDSKDSFVKDRDMCKTWGGGTIMGM
jgi:hypothetical protein